MVKRFLQCILVLITPISQSLIDWSTTCINLSKHLNRYRSMYQVYTTFTWFPAHRRGHGKNWSICNDYSGYFMFLCIVLVQVFHNSYQEYSRNVFHNLYQIRLQAKIKLKPSEQKWRKYDDTKISQKYGNRHGRLPIILNYRPCSNWSR